MKYFSFFIAFLFTLNFTSCQTNKEPVDYVNPFIGTGGHGHTYPGATLPFGMVQLSPDTRLEGWDGCSGYHYSDSVIYGFSHTHLSGTGIADYCDILLMPTTGRYFLNNGYKTGVSNGYASRFSKKTEKAAPGYYAVRLDDYDIQVELTATTRVGLHKYLFPKNKKDFVILDLTHRDQVLDSYFKQVNAYEFEGLRRSRSWAQDQYVYFVMRFNQPIKQLHLAVNDSVIPNLEETRGKNIKAVFDFGRLKNPELLVKVGISAVSAEGARKNLEAELPDWDFNRVRTQARRIWNRELKKIAVKASAKTKTIFYTALYHTMIVPNVFMDTDGRYRGTDLKIHRAKNFTNYTVFSLWDTFRATHPLYTIIEQARTNDFIKTFIHQYLNGGQLPVWELAGNYTGCMIGYHSVSVIADAYLKGLRDYDINTAFEAMKHSAMMDHLGLKYYKTLGYIPADKEPSSVSKTLEYAYDDWCIAQVAKALNRTDDYAYFLKRAQFYKNIFDPRTKFMRPKYSGAWKFPFDPREVDFNYTEANAWQYTFFVPQDVDGLIRLTGGAQAFARKLDQLFTAESKTTGRKQADITGLIGQYAHGNEPSHHIAYLYDYAGQPWKTQAMVHKILHEMYSDRPDGYAGNEDCGQMSAWYVLSAMGFYSVTPGSGIYAIGTPILKEARLNLENGHTFVIQVKNLSPQNKYIQSATLNGQPYFHSYLSHQTILNGGKLVFIMGLKPNRHWGASQNDRPVAAITDHLILPMPAAYVKKRLFNRQIRVTLADADTNAQIYYAVNRKMPQRDFRLYENPLLITQTSTIRFFAKRNALRTPTDTLRLRKFPEGRSIRLLTRPSPQYTAGSDSALIDGITGGTDFSNGYWQGYEGNDLDAIIDLGKPKRVSYLSAHFLQDINSWIFMPLYVDFFASNDGQHFKKLGRVKNTVSEHQWGAIPKNFALRIKPVRTRYIRVIAKNRGLCPAWHKGHGGKAWIFIDEITIK